MHDVERVELEVVVFVKPCAGEIVEAQASAPRESQRVDHKLGDRLFFRCVGFVVENVNRTVADLQHVNVASERGIRSNGNIETELRLHVHEVIGGKIDRDFHSNGHGVVGEHEVLELIVPPFIVGYSLEHESCDARRKVVPFFDLDAVEVEGGFPL